MVRIILEGSEAADIFHAGEHEAHRRFGVEAEANELSGTVQPGLSSGHARFIATQPFFFLSARERDGAIHIQMVACVQTAQGAYPLVAFGDHYHFYFLLNESEGTRLLELTADEGCPVGAIFVDFARRARVRVNGLLQVAPDDALSGFECPAGHRLMAMAVQQAYANCNSRIVKLGPAPAAV